MNKHITVGTVQDDQYLIDNFLAQKKITWPVPKTSKIGDMVYLLIPSMTGSIIAQGLVATLPVKSENWKSKYESILENIKFSVDQPSIEYIGENIPEWDYLTSARTYTTIPNEYLSKFESLVGVFDDKPRLYREVNELEIQDALLNNLFSDIELKFLGYLLTAPDHTLNAIQLSSLMGYSQFGGANFVIGSIGKKISERYMIHPPYWNKEGPNWWSVIADGEKKNYFYWTLKPQVISALNKSKLQNMAGFEYENDEATSFSEEGNEEGGRINVLVSIYERDSANRKACIEFHGCKCAICGFDFELFYGEIGKGYIQVHHIIPLNEIKSVITINPKTDLVPLCSNCHSIIHRKKPSYSLTEIQNKLKMHPSNL